jgi:hypothetical protein
MAFDIIDRIAIVDCWFKNQVLLMGIVQTAEAANELFALAGEHRSSNDLNPTGLFIVFHTGEDFKAQGIFIKKKRMTPPRIFPRSSMAT